MFSEELSCRIVFIEEELSREEDFVILIQFSGYIFGREGLELVGRYEPEPFAYFQELCMVEFVFEGVDVLDKQKLVLLSPLVLYLNLLVFVHNKGLVKEIDFGFLRIIDLLPNSLLIFAITDSLH